MNVWNVNILNIYDILRAVLYAMYKVFYLIHTTTLQSGQQNHVSV